jgi:competence protein ComFC
MTPLFNFFSSLEEFIYPPLCPICDNEIKKSKIVCQRCFDGIYSISDKKCKFCGKPIKHGRVCKGCKKTKPFFDSIISCGSYVPPLSDIIKLYKFKNRPSLSIQLARKLYTNYNSRADIENTKHLTWVPMRRVETRERGYNQSRLLALEFSKLSSLKSLDLLYKSANIPSQTTLPYKQRLNNVKNAYKIKEKALKKLKETPEGILLIDDVLTTGSTLNECAKRLKEAGFKKVTGLVLAISP